MYNDMTKMMEPFYMDVQLSKKFVEENSCQITTPIQSKLAGNQEEILEEKCIRIVFI